MLYVLGLYENKGTILCVNNHYDYGPEVRKLPEEHLVLRMNSCRLQLKDGGLADAEFCTINVSPYMWIDSCLYIESTALDDKEPYGFFEKGFENIRLTNPREGRAFPSPRLITTLGSPVIASALMIYDIVKV